MLLAKSMRSTPSMSVTRQPAAWSAYTEWGLRSTVLRLTPPGRISRARSYSVALAVGARDSLTAPALAG